MISSPAIPSTAGEPGHGIDRFLAFLIALPVLVLAWPGPANPIAGDLATAELSATGVALLASLPAALLSAWLRPIPRPALLLLLLAWLASSLAPAPTESLQHDRAWMGLLVGMALAVAAGALGFEGRNSLVRWLAVTTLLLVGRALFGPPPGWGGVLDNTGELSGAALPGALCGLFLWARCRSGWRWVGLGAVGMFLVHAVVAPVLASLVTVPAVGLCACLLGWKRLESTARARLVLASLLALFGLGWATFGPPVVSPGPEGPAEIANQPAPTTLGGVEVRRRIWRATLSMVGESPLVGVGSGQFGAAFPPYRDPVEIESSVWHRRVENLTEVEHPHNDWLLFFAEGGIAGGIAWSAFLLLVAAGCVRRLRESSPVEAAISAGALGALVGALFNCPLTFNPTASAASFALFGAVLTGTQPVARGKFGRLLPLGVAVLLVLYAPRAHAFWKLGRSMAEFGETTSTTAKDIAVDEALAACPDSVVALSLKARLLDQREGDRQGALAMWERVLALRPYRFEALMNGGVLLARLGELSEAGERLDRALAIDGGHPGLIRSRVYNFAERGLLDQALAEVDRLEATGHYDAADLLNLGCKLILRGMDREGLRLAARSDPRFESLTGEGALAFGDEYTRSGNPLAADAFKALAHVLWGRGHAATGRWDDARRSYRQNLRITRDHVKPAGPTRLRMEFAAVLWKSRQPEDARAQLEGLEPSIGDWVAMPQWAGQTLIDIGFGVEKY